MHIDCMAALVVTLSYFAKSHDDFAVDVSILRYHGLCVTMSGVMTLCHFEQRHFTFSFTDRCLARVFLAKQR